ncbi:MAG: ASKHA domain-containing protein [Clostridia bacterium]|nr:ASKHA domain-containing protein [Clostridia bacterium]
MSVQITVFSPEGTKKIKAAVGEVLADNLSSNGFNVSADCGRQGVCGKCAVKLVDGEFLNVTPDENGMILSCRAIICADASIEVSFINGTGLTEFSGVNFKKGVCGIAIDIGTTTVAAAMIQKDGSVTTASRLNSQSVFGADVLSRISACSDGKLNEMTKQIRSCITELISELDSDGNAEEIIISGNTTMLHIFCGISPVGMGAFPFIPEFTNAVYLSGKSCGLSAGKITVLPSASAFIGSDIISGVFALGLHKTDKKILFADLGTNGELVLSDRGKIYCTSTAAGPALEGACIECGTGGIEGAISSVFIEDGEIGYTTVGGKVPVGICGAGLTDLISVLLQEKKLDPSGHLDSDRIFVSRNVYVSQSDVRQFQTAKSAIISGIETLAEAVGISFDDIDELCLAGGLGYYINPESSITTGLIPTINREKIRAVGNTSLCGALMCIGNPEAIKEMQKIADSCRIVDLGGNADFGEKFINNMFFPE